MAVKRTLMYVANALREQAAAADAEMNDGKSLQYLLLLTYSDDGDDFSIMTIDILLLFCCVRYTIDSVCFYPCGYCRNMSSVVVCDTIASTKRQTRIKHYSWKAQCLNFRMGGQVRVGTIVEFAELYFGNGDIYSLGHNQ